MENPTRTFNRPGRPREDVVQRRLEIYEAVAPMLRARGLRGLSMAQAAKAAAVSVGTLYHYFSNKRALVLYGLNPEPADLICERFAKELAPDDAAADVRRGFALLIVRTVDFMRASVNAAIELGPTTLREQLDEVAKRPVRGFADLLTRSLPPDDPRPVEQVERAVRRSVVSAVMEKHFDPHELRRQLVALLAGA